MQRWTPDEQLIPAVRAGRCTLTYAQMTPPDRAWVVAGLSTTGCTAERIAELLACSLRTVRVVKADPLTAVCAAYQLEASVFERETRLLRSELTTATRERDAAILSAGRLRTHLARITASRTDTGQSCSKGHVMSAYNTYRDRSGRAWCRTCHRDRQAQHRAKRKNTCPSAG